MRGRGKSPFSQELAGGWYTYNIVLYIHITEKFLYEVMKYLKIILLVNSFFSPVASVATFIITD